METIKLIFVFAHLLLLIMFSMKNFLNESVNILTTIFGYVPHFIVIYLGLGIVHYVSSNLYPVLCTPLTLSGFIMTPFIVVTPHCQGLRWIIHYTGDQIRNTWVWVGSYLVYYITQYITPYFVKTVTNEKHDDHVKEE